MEKVIELSLSEVASRWKRSLPRRHNCITD